MFIPKNDHQATRIRRLLIAAASYLLGLAAMVYCYFTVDSGPRLTLPVLILWLALPMLANACFYAIIRSGLNRRLKDPSLTIPQLVMALIAATVLIYYAGEVRGVMSMFYLVVFTFGLFRLDTRQFLGITGFTLIIYGGMMTLLMNNPDASVSTNQAATNTIVVATVLPWFAVIGGYITRLRGRLRETNTRLEQALDTISELAVRDELTGAYNRRHLLDSLEHHKELARRSDLPFAVCLFDLDHFKQINDEHGHLAGDHVLARLTEAVAGKLRSVDVLARFEGEEFVIVLPDTDLQGAQRLADRLHAMVAELDYPDVEADLGITISIGITEYQRDESINALLGRVDRALYRAKAAGRNHTVPITASAQEQESPQA